MAGTIRKLKSGKYQARYVHPRTGKQVSAGTFLRHQDAKDALTNLAADMSRGEWVDPVAGRMTLREWSEVWLAAKTVSRRSLDSYRSDLRIHILPTLGDESLAKLSSTDVREWYGTLVERGKPSAAAKAYRTLKTCLNAAVDDGKIRRNPCNVKGASTSKSTREIQPLTLDELWRVHDAMVERYRSWVLVAGYGGLRWGELAALRVGDIDLDTGIVRVTKQLQEARSGGGFHETAPKTSAGRRSVGLPPFVVDSLRAHIEAYTDGKPESRLFTTPEGTDLRDGNFRRREWKHATEGLSKPRRIHDLRHTCASIAINAGVDIKQLQQQLGHATAAMTLDLYGHLYKDAPAAVAAKLAGSGRPDADAA
jgi:integrase